MDDVTVVALGVSLIWACLGAYLLRRVMLIAAVRNDGDEPVEEGAPAVGGMSTGGEWDGDELDHGDTYAPMCRPRLGF